MFCSDLYYLIVDYCLFYLGLCTNILALSHVLALYLRKTYVQHLAMRIKSSAGEIYIFDVLLYSLWSSG